MPTNTPRNAAVRRSDLVEPELSYQIVGVLFSVHAAIGPMQPERVYQRAVAAAFRHAGIAFREQVMVPMAFENVCVGKHVLDFLVDSRVILELKRAADISRADIDQVLSYLVAHNLHLGILAYFGAPRLSYRRILNNPKPTIAKEARTSHS